MTLCLLVRHAAHDLVDRVLVGRMNGIALGEAGRLEAASLREFVRPFDVACIQSSPRQRAVETATAIAQAKGLRVEVCPALDEMDFGAWTGLSFAELASDACWRSWNTDRARTRPPGGESMQEAQARIVSHLRRVHEHHPRGRVVIVTHAEIIRAAVLHAMSLPLDDWWRIEVQPASVTRFEIRSSTHSIVGLGTRTTAA